MSGRRSEYEEKQLADLLTRFQDAGIVVYGQIEGVPGTYAKILVKSDGTVKVEGVTTISGTVDVSDRWARQVGQIDIARYLGSAIGVANPLHDQIVYGGVVIDPRDIRALGANVDHVTAHGDIAILRQVESGDLGVELRMDAISYDPRQIRALTSSDIIDVSDRAARLVGIIYGSLGQLQQRGTSLDLYTAIRYAGSEIDPRSIRALTSSDIMTAYGSQTQALLQRATTYDLYVQLRSAGIEIDPRDVSDRAARLVGVVYGSQSQQLLQRALTYESVVQLSHQGTEYDARQIRALISTDVITAYGSQTQALLQRALTYELLTTIRQGGSELSISNPLFAGIVDASGNRLPSMDASARPGYVDVIDKAARLLGVIYGSQAQQLQQKASTYELLVDVVDRATRLLGTIQDVTKVVTPTYLAPVMPGAGGTATIVSAPGAGYKLRLKGIQISVDGATRIDLRWATNTWRSYYLPANSSIERNFISENIEGGNNQALTLLCSAAGVYVTASATTETLAV